MNGTISLNAGSIPTPRPRINLNKWVCRILLERQLIPWERERDLLICKWRSWHGQHILKAFVSLAGVSIETKPFSGTCRKRKFWKKEFIEVTLSEVPLCCLFLTEAQGASPLDRHWSFSAFSMCSLCPTSRGCQGRAQTMLLPGPVCLQSAVGRRSQGGTRAEWPRCLQGRHTGQAPAQALPPSSALPSSPCSPLPWSSLLLLPQNLFSCLCRVSFPCIACSASYFHPEIWGKHPPSPKPVSQNWGINCILQSVWPPAKHLQNITATEPGFQNHWNVLSLDSYEGTLVYPDSFIFSF